MSRWTLRDTVTNEVWEMPISPDSMSSPFGTKNFQFASGLRAGLDRIRTFTSPGQPVGWEWGGVIRTKAHYDALEDWASKSVPIEVTDHLARTWLVFLTSFEPTDRPPTVLVQWRLRYSMKSLLLRQV